MCKFTKCNTESQEKIFIHSIIKHMPADYYKMWHKLLDSSFILYFG
jgi:hypothetical protein